MRQDGPFIEAGENDNLIVQRLKADPNALGIFGYSFLFENTDTLKAGGGRRRRARTPRRSPTAATRVSRPLFIYVKNAHRGVIPGLEEFLAEYVSEEAFGPDGYLPERGLIPLARRRARGGARGRRGRQPHGPLQLSPLSRGARRRARLRAPCRRGDRCSATCSSRSLALSLVAYFVGHASGRRFAAADGAATHSLPSYHGAFVAIWVGVPALILVLLWLPFQGSVIDGLLLAQPARRRDRRRDAAQPQPDPVARSTTSRPGAIFAEPSPESPRPPSGSTAGRRIARIALFVRRARG